MMGFGLGAMWLGVAFTVLVGTGMLALIVWAVAQLVTHERRNDQ